MNVSSHLRGSIVALPRQRWVCLFLAFFLLYNPFFATPSSGNSLEVCHPVSHRATVGASELQHLAPADGWGCFSAMDITEAEISAPLPDLLAAIFFHLPSVPRFSRQFFGPGLWFRPPPAR